MKRLKLYQQIIKFEIQYDMKRFVDYHRYLKKYKP